MYERLQRLVAEDKITMTGLQNAVVKGWITEEQYAELVATRTAPKQGKTDED